MPAARACEPRQRLWRPSQVHSDTFQRRSTLPALVDALLKLHCVMPIDFWLYFVVRIRNTQALMLARQLQLDFHEVTRHC